MESGNVSTKDPNLINISVYKPNALCSFWSWFSRKNKNNLTDILERGDNFDIKLNMDDLNALKIKGIDLQKLQNCKFIKPKSTYKNNTSLNAKNHLGTNHNAILNDTVISNLIMKENMGKNKKTYEKRIMSTSTISIKSKTNFGTRNVKYVRNITSQKSIINSVSNSQRKTRVRDNKSTESNALNRSVLLKSVPTAILRSNTQKKVFVPLHIGRRKTEKTSNKWQNNNLQDVKDNIQEQKYDDPCVIPMILTKMKSMEEQICDIGNTTKKINEVVSQNSIKRTNSLPKDLSQSNHNRQSFSKAVPTHKIYSRNIQGSKKSKPSTHKKMKNKSKLTIPTTFNDYHQVQDIRFQTLHSAENPFNNFGKKSNDRKKTFNKLKTPLEIDIVPNTNNHNIGNSTRLNQNEAVAKTNKSEELPKINQKIDYDFVLNLLKGMSDAKDNQIGFVQPNINNTKQNIEVNKDVFIKPNSLMSKPTFDWKHKSLSSASETHIEMRKESNFKDNTDAKDIIENKPLNLNINTSNLPSDNTNDVLKYNAITENDKLQIESKKETDELIEETRMGTKSVFNTQAKITPEVHSLVQISGKEFIKQDYSLIICRDMLKSDQENNNCITPKNTSRKEIKVIDTVSKSNYKQQLPNKSEVLDSSEDVHHQTVEISECTIRPSKSKQKNSININELFLMKESFVKKMITRATQSEPDPNDVVKVCVETTSGDKVKIENLSCGKGLTVVTSSRVSLVKATTALHEKSVNRCDEENKNNNSLILPKNSNITPKNCTISETLNKEDRMYLPIFESNHESPIDKGYINKQGHIYKGIDKFVPAKGIESERCTFRCPGEYISQEKRKTYEELLKKGPMLSQCSDETIHRPNLSAKINEITVFEEPFRKPASSYPMIQEAKHSNSFMSTVDMQLLNPKNKQLSTTYTEKNKLLVDKRELGSGVENFTKSQYENPVRSKKRSNISELNQCQETPINKQSFFTVRNEKNELYSNPVVSHQSTLESKRRSCRYGLTIQEPIAEESDNADTILENTVSDFQSEKGDNIKVKSFDKSLCSELVKKNRRESQELENSCNVFTAQLNTVETAFNYLKDLTYTKTSVSVQTDWSLIGITIDHFKQNQPGETSKTSISCQTEITMDQLSPSVIANTILPITCSPCMIKSINTDTDKKATKYDVISCHTSEDKKQNSDDGKLLNIVIAENLDNEINAPDKISERITYSNFQASKQSKANYTKDIDFKIFTELKCNEHEIDLKKIPRNKNATEQHHDCSISCFPSISEETILSDHSELNYEQILSTEFNSTVSEMHKNSIISCYNINKEVISINKVPNIVNMIDVDKGSSLKSNPLFQIPTNPETNQTLFRNQNNMKVAHFLPLPLDNAEHKSNVGLISNSNTTIKIFTTNEEIYSPINETHTEYQYNTFKNNICTRISTG